MLHEQINNDRRHRGLFANCLKLERRMDGRLNIKRKPLHWGNLGNDQI